MYKFITVRCRSCGSVIYNLPEKDIRRLKLVNLICEDCMEHEEIEGVKTKISGPGHLKHTS